MKKFAFAAAAAFVALFGTFLLSNAAQAYPDVQVNLTSDHEVVYGGESFTVTASANVTCAWDLSWDNTSRAANGSDFKSTFVAPEVTKITKKSVVGQCSYVGSAAGRSTSSPVVTPRQLTITILPAASSAAGPNKSGASLAGTGGPDRAVLLGGVALLFAGATVAIIARRRAEDAELPSQTV
jgi:hypothetical protein